MKKNLYDKIFYLLLSLIIGVCWFFFLKDSSTKLHYFILYISILLFASSWPNWKILRFLKVIILLPSDILLLLAPIVKSFYQILFAFLFCFGLLILVLKSFPEFYFNIDLNIATKAYLIFTFGSILLVVYGEKILSIINKWENKNKSEEYIKAQQELTLSILNQKRIKYCIFLLYFIIIVVNSILSLNKSQIVSDHQDLSIAILQSFASYLAFERLHTNTAYFPINIRKYLIKHFNLIKITFDKKFED